MAVTKIDEATSYQDMQDILNSLLTDITTVRSALNAVVTKLNADAWVTDTNYAAAWALGTTAS